MRMYSNAFMLEVLELIQQEKENIIQIYIDHRVEEQVVVGVGKLRQ